MSVADLIKYLQQFEDYAEVQHLVQDRETGTRYSVVRTYTMGEHSPVIYLEVSKAIQFSGSIENVEED